MRLIRGEKMIKLKHIYIREAKVTDVETLVVWWATGELMEHVGFPSGIQTNIEKLRTELEIQKADSRALSKRFMIIKNDGSPIGELSFHNLDLTNKSCEIGIKICEMSEQGKGYGEEALRGFIAHLFNTYQLHRIELDTLLENRRAQNLYQKVGFKVVGVKRDVWLDPLGNYRSAVVMDLLRHEF